MDIEEELVVDDYEIIEDAFRTEMLQQLMFLLAHNYGPTRTLWKCG